MAISRRFVARFGLDNNNQSLINIGQSGSNLTRSGAHDLTLVTGGTTSVTIPAGTITLADLSTNQTFTGAKTFTGKIVLSASGNELTISGTGSTFNVNPATTGSISNVSANLTSTTVSGTFTPHGYSFKSAAEVATTAALTLNTAQTTIDGVTITSSSRVLIKDQTTQSQNGIYTNVTTTSWTRVADADTSSELAAAIISVEKGNVNGGKTFKTTFKSTDTINTTAVVWNDIGIASGGTYTATNNNVVLGNIAGSNQPVQELTITDLKTIGLRQTYIQSTEPSNWTFGDAWIKTI